MAIIDVRLRLQYERKRVDNDGTSKQHVQ